MEDQQNSMTPKQQTVDRLKNSLSIVVTLGNQPTADEYASAIGLVNILRRFGKKASVVTNTVLPGELKFLAPGESVTNKLDHLRDFVIELDKDKADKLRYEPSETSVKIFITPYKQEITQADLRFSQGNYNVDTVIAIGATSREALDGALKDHAQLLQDALIITLSAGEKLASFGGINWQEPTASSVAEMLVSVADALQNGLLDQATSQVLLTALVAATDRFHNHKTTPKVMTIAAQLIAAGADPQVVMTHFETQQSPQTNTQPGPSAKPVPPAVPTPPAIPKADSTSLDIQHESTPKKHSRSHRSTGNRPKAAQAPQPVVAPAPAPRPQQTILPAVKPNLTTQPDTIARHSSAGDNLLAADAIDALMQSTKEQSDEYQTAPAASNPVPEIPLMQHRAVAAPAAPLPSPAPAPPITALPVLPVAPQPAPLPSLPIAPLAMPAAPAPLPVVPEAPIAAPAPSPVAPASADSSIDAARQAVEQAVSQMSQSPAPNPAAAPATPGNDNIFVAPDGTLQYASPPANQ